MARVPTTFPFSIDWLPDGRLLIVSGRDRPAAATGSRRLARPRTRISPRISDRAWNEIVVDAGGNAYVNGSGFDFAGRRAARARASSPSSRPTALRGRSATTARFPNGMAITPDDSTLIVAESYAQPAHRVRHRRRRRALEPARLGRSRQRRAGRHLPRCRRRGLVRRRPEPALRARARRRRGAADRRRRPRLLRLHARRRGWQHAVHRGRGVERSREHGRRECGPARSSPSRLRRRTRAGHRRAPSVRACAPQGDSARVPKTTSMRRLPEAVAPSHPARRDGTASA